MGTVAAIVFTVSGEMILSSEMPGILGDFGQA